MLRVTAHERYQLPAPAHFAGRGAATHESWTDADVGMRALARALSLRQLARVVIFSPIGVAIDSLAGRTVAALRRRQ